MQSSDAPAMRCADAREGISSRLDGEAAPLGALDAHLVGCPECREWADDAARLERLPATVAGDDPAPVVPAAPPRHGTVGLAVGTLVAYALVIAVVASQGTERYAINGDTYPGALTAYGAAIGRLTGTLAAAVTLGALVFAVLRAAVQDTGELGLRGYLAHGLARRAAQVWAVVCVPMVLLAAADTAGQNLADVFHAGGVWALISASETAKGWFWSFVFAVIVLVALQSALSWIAHAWLLLPAGLGLLAVTVTANEAQGPNHDYSTSALMALTVTAGVWLGGLWAQSTVPWRAEKRWTGPVFGVVTLAYGTVIALIMAPGADLTGTLYGRFVLAAGVLVALAAVLQFLRRTVPAATLLTLACGTAIAASLLTPPPFLAHRFTIGQVFLGYDVLQPPSAARFATLWRWDLNLAPLAVVLAVGYLLLVRRIRRSPESGGWPWYRTACFLFGCLALVVLTSSGINTYATVLFSVHMVAHMLMTSLVPVFLLLGAPITLLRETLTGGPAEWLERVLASRSFEVAMRPVVQIAVFALTLYGLYFTPLYDRIGRYHWGHAGIYAVVLLTGFLFYWRVFQIDPVPRRMPFIGRVGMLLAMMPVSMFFAIIVMTMNGLIGPRLYGYFDLPWMTDLHHDQFVGGVVAWACDEAAIALVTVGLVLHWAWRSSREDAAETE
ncbi:cytochrome c oxidase assembly protein [Tsukamurella soli]|uniref:Cytochrome c oxidase assembly protein n=1 Tax=Tsukamurella soli TaxID=644556 RepID=A0ABP8JX13_9ACTN